MTTSSTERFNVYEAITNLIIASVEAGSGNVQMPWHRAGGMIERPVNVASRKAYRGINTVALWAAADACGFAHGIWGTYCQWQEKGAQVRKGEKSSLIIFYRDLVSGDGETSAANDQDRAERRFVARASRVFNLAQVDGFTLDQPEPDEDCIEPCDRAEQFIAATAASIVISGTSAHYDRRADRIVMPDRFRFTGTTTSSASESWYSTLLHELTHWSGAENRMARTFGERFGDDAYAMEEMVPCWPFPAISRR